MPGRQTTRAPRRASSGRCRVLRALRRDLVGISAVLAIAGCSAGATDTVGRVSDVRGRLCVQTSKDDGFCFTTPAAVLSKVQLGDCVRVTFSGGGAGRTPRADTVNKVASGCPTTSRPRPTAS